MITLSREQIERLHQVLIEKTGGLNGLRDSALLDSALAAPFQTFEGEELFPSTVAKIARTAYGLIKIIRFRTEINASALM